MGGFSLGDFFYGFSKENDGELAGYIDIDKHLFL
jgi:hypothetical protein